MTTTVMLAATPPAGLTSGEVLGFVLLDIVIILIAARLVGRLFTRIGQPRVVGEIVAGILLGPTLLGAKVFTWSNAPEFLGCDRSLAAAGSPSEPSITACLFPAQSQSVLAIVGQLALILFMFLVGIELDWRLLRGRGRGIATVSVGVVLIPVLAAFIVGPLLYTSQWVGGFGTDDQPSQLAFTLMVGAMISVSAFPVMARILQEKKMMATGVGAVGVASAAVVTVLMFLVVAVAAGVAAEAPAADQVRRLVGTGIFIGVMFGLVRPLLARHLGPRVEAQGNLTAAQFAGVIILMFASALVADRIGINVIPGAFLAGAVLPAREVMLRDLASRLSDLTVVILLPIFLAYSGLRTDLTTLGLSFAAGIGIFLASSIVAKWGGGAVSARLGGLSWREGNLLGILLNTRGLLVLVVGLIGLSLGVLSPAMQAAGVLMAIVTTAMTGPLFDRFVARGQAEASQEPAPVAPGSNGDR